MRGWQNEEKVDVGKKVVGQITAELWKRKRWKRL